MNVRPDSQDAGRARDRRPAGPPSSSAQRTGGVARGVPTPLRLHIERLVLDGLDLNSRDAALLQGALEAELAARFENGVLPSPGALASLRAPTLTFPPDARPAAMGRALAGALAAALAGPHPGPLPAGEGDAARVQGAGPLRNFGRRPNAPPLPVGEGRGEGFSAQSLQP